jgi:hypothetical protein
VASFFSALRKYFASTLALHAFAEAVLLMTAAYMGLKRAFRQRSFSSNGIPALPVWLVVAFGTALSAAAQRT